MQQGSFTFWKLDYAIVSSNFARALIPQYIFFFLRGYKNIKHGEVLQAGKKKKKPDWSIIRSTEIPLFFKLSSL